MYIDSHFHIDSMINKDVDVVSLFKELKEDGFLYGIDIGTTSNDLGKRLEISEKLEGKIFSSFASGPWQLVQETNISKILKELEDNYNKYKDRVIALGEFGLDYYYNYGTKEKQFDLAKQQILLANSLNLPVILHNREADRDFEKLLDKYPPNKIILHCFSGDKHLSDFAKEREIYLSFSGNITYKSNNELREIASSYLSTHILCETDSPYLPPQKKRGKVNTPLNVKEVYNLISDLRNISIEELSLQVQNNFERLFLLDK